MDKIKKTTPPSNVKSPVTTGVKTADQPITSRTATTIIKEKTVTHLFDKNNYKWMLVGLIVIAVGFVLMAGGKSTNPNVFQDSDVYSFRRITLAPILIIAGFIIEVIAIMRKPAVKGAA